MICIVSYGLGFMYFYKWVSFGITKRIFWIFYNSKNSIFFNQVCYQKQVPYGCVLARFVFCLCYYNWVGIELNKFAKKKLWFFVDFSCGTTWGIELREGLLYAKCEKKKFKNLEGRSMFLFQGPFIPLFIFIFSFSLSLSTWTQKLMATTMATRATTTTIAIKI